jgi:hypothetical protein
MKNIPGFIFLFLFTSLAVAACGSVPVTGGETPADTEASLPTSTPAPIATLRPSATATPALQLEVLQSQIWTDSAGQLRLNVLLHNPYDFPVEPRLRSRTSLKDSLGEFMRDEALYYLDGISGGHGFVLPGETIAANACFTCEREAVTEEWKSVDFNLNVQDATTSLNYFTDVEVISVNVSFEGDSPIFYINGTVKNNTAEALQRISTRVFVYDQDGKLVGAAEASAWDVAPGASASFNGYGFGQSNGGSLKYETSALGVKY